MPRPEQQQADRMSQPQRSPDGEEQGTTVKDAREFNSFMRRPGGWDGDLEMSLRQDRVKFWGFASPRQVIRRIRRPSVGHAMPYLTWYVGKRIDNLLFVAPVQELS